jgi:hypothetical protein
MIQGGALAPSLRGMGLHLSMVPGLNGVMDIVVITDLMACGGTTRRKVALLLLPRLGTPGPRSVKDVAEGVVATCAHR